MDSCHSSTVAIYRAGKGWWEIENPAKNMSAQQLAEAQAKAGKKMHAHRSTYSGDLSFDGHGDNLCTAKDYTNFVLLLEFKIEKNDGSGIYLRGTPQVQIWDPVLNGVGSGSLYINKSNPCTLLVAADRPIGVIGML